MEDQRQQFRFRLPWLPPAPAAVRPPVEGGRVASRPPFRPAEAAPPTSPSQPPPPPDQAPLSTVPASPSHAAPPSPAATQPALPSQIAPQARATSQPPSPSRVTSQPQSPPELAPKSLSTPLLSSQLRQSESTPLLSQIEPLVQPTAGPSSPPKIQNATQNESQHPKVSDQNSPPVLLQQQPSKPETTQPFIQETKPKVDYKEKPQTKIDDNQSHVVAEHPSQVLGNNTADTPPSAAAAETLALPQKLHLSSATGMNLKAIPEAERKLDDAQVKKVEQQVIETATKDQFEGEPKQKAETHFTKQEHGIDEQGQLPNEEILDKKQVLPTSGARRKLMETMIPTYPKVSRLLPKPITAPPMGGNACLPNEVKEDITKFVHKLGIGQAKQPLDDKPYSIITLAGENKGATMNLGLEPVKREGSIHIYRGYKIKPDESVNTTTDEEGSSKRGKSGEQKAEEDKATEAHINSNAQGINNSLVFSSSITETNPGVKLVHSRSPTEPVKLKNI
ncbi:hypothetical protein Nepgr_018046 [Nepenthes gracilis]|uniref:Uncharacterized protein n=1 Tax=Nepenthes gracilis TaxID=150966 RepID=A0AAD3SQK1_NEPGR|nr:hypothetical protein Nepgr_018046 [Nepenthes gracilis]